MPIAHPDPDRAAGPSRRAFLSACSALVLSLAGCGHVSPRMRSAYALLSDPPFTGYQAVLTGIVRAVLPAERSDFPVTPAQVEARLLRLFELERDPRFLALQKTLVIFEQTDLFAELAPVDAELTARDARERGLDAAALMAALRRQDRELADAFARSLGDGAPRFSTLRLEDQRAYLDLWRRSGFLLKQQFYASARALVMISAYSMEAVWPAIGYDGPLLPRRRT
ncbi:MAG TPA: hypothetical protein VN654_11020 [Vicinamibacterales bacterium]|nr:hypothetical protein [Vicinamibacterales bacterium]